MPDPLPPPLPSLGHAGPWLATGSAVALAILTRAWQWVGLPAYWAFRHLLFLVVERDGDLVRAKWSKLYEKELQKNAESAAAIEVTRRDVSELMTSVSKGLPQIGDLAQSVGLMAQRVGDVAELLRDVGDKQRAHGEELASLSATLDAWDGRERRRHNADDRRSPERRARLPRKDNT